MVVAVVAALVTSSGSDLDEWLERVRREAALPGLAVAIVTLDGGVAFHGLGADAEGAPITPHTPFALGALSASFTAMGVMVLAERGALSLDDEASRWVSEVPAGVTVRHLLHQRSGLPASAGAWVPGPMTLEARVHALAEVRATSAPGARFEFSNANADVLGRLIERVSGQPYAVFMRAAVLTPLGLSEVWLPSERAGRLLGYQDWFGAYRSAREADEWTDANAPSGGAAGTAAGLAEALRFHLGLAEANSPLSPRGLAELHAPVATEVPGTSYAMGWTVRQLDGEPMLLHTGQTAEFTATMALFPSRGLGVAALTNVNGFSSAATRPVTRDVVTGVAQVLAGRAPATSAIFGYRNQPATKWLFAVVTLGGLARLVVYWRTRPRQPRWYALFDVFVAVVLLSLPRVAQVPLAALLRFTPDLALMVVLGAVGALSRAAGRWVLGGRR